MCHILGTLYAQLDFVDRMYGGVAYCWMDFRKPIFIMSKLGIYFIFFKE